MKLGASFRACAFSFARDSLPIGYVSHDQWAKPAAGHADAVQRPGGALPGGRLSFAGSQLISEAMLEKERFCTKR
jgi:hypothetical protein